MFNFFVALDGHWCWLATTFRRNFKAPSLRTNSTKNEGPSENKGFTENLCEDCRREKNFKKQYSRHLWNNPVEDKGPNRNSFTWALQLERNKLTLLREAFRLNCQTFCRTPTSQVVICSTCLWSWLAIASSMTLPESPRSGPDSRPCSSPTLSRKYALEAS